MSFSVFNKLLDSSSSLMNLIFGSDWYHGSCFDNIVRSKLISAKEKNNTT